MKNIKRVIALVFAIVFCLSATVIASAETHTIDGAILEFKPLQGDVNVDGFLNLKDIVRYKKYVLQYEVDFDTEVADFNADEDFNASDLIPLQEAILDNLFQ